MGPLLDEIAEFRDRLKVHFRHHVVDTGKVASFWVALSFLVTFGFVRYITYSIRKKKLDEQKHPHLAKAQRRFGFGFHDIVLPGGLHIHHAVPGIFLALMAGYLGLIVEKKAIRPISIMYGIGAALTLDEFALWLELRDVYWSKNGRRSFEAVAIAGSLFMGGVALSQFGGAIIRDLRARRKTGKYPPHHTDLAVDLPPDVESGTISGVLPMPQSTASVSNNSGSSKVTTPRRAAQ